MLKKILIGVFALIVLLVAAIAIGPRFVNWNSYKGKVAEQVRAATGRDLGHRWRHVAFAAALAGALGLRRAPGQPARRQRARTWRASNPSRSMWRWCRC